jgi:hypothetical protein
MTAHVHTLAMMELSASAWEEIARKMHDAGYDHVFSGDGMIDMNGIAVVKTKPEPSQSVIRDPYEIIANEWVDDA